MVTTYWTNKFFNASFRGISFNPPTKLYIGLSTTQPYENGTGVTEPVDASYARLDVTCNTTNFSLSVDGKIENAVNLEFAEATNDWNTPSSLIKYYAVFDTATGGNLLWYGELSKVRNIEADSILRIPAGGISFSVSNEV